MYSTNNEWVLRSGRGQLRESLYSTLQGVSVTHHTILWRVGSTTYNNHTLEPF
jgi:hypothetical protein